MKRVLFLFLFLAGTCGLAGAQEQPPKKLSGADERFKADILVVVAHPDDEGAVTPYLARAIYDLHKRVAVVFGTHGGSGANNYGAERAGALTDIREIEAREACARLGITNAWFLDGKDTASQNVLNSLANWGHGANLEKMVELIRLTRPEVIITSLPGVFIGENHGDHQATGVIATEAFDLAANQVVFPAQIAGASGHREIYLENLQPWQVKKIYYFPDANDEKQFSGTGPAYSIKEISPSQKKPYWRIALDAATTHLTQYPADIERIQKMSDAEVEKMMSDPDAAWWSEPETLVFGKSYYVSKATDDVFAKLEGEPNQCPGLAVNGQRPQGVTAVKIGGPWGFYQSFREAHCLVSLRVADPPEIAVMAGGQVYVPLTITHAKGKALKLQVKVEVPKGWRVTAGEGEISLSAEATSELRVEVETPKLTASELKTNDVQEIVVHALVDGAPAGDIRLRVQLRAHGLPQ
ncbi:MAG TPA: PIG-L family deacetylase [Candidatus Acidoferrum sp.]|nr:PIG-L family deacetylase [Candidatus Acidoferrum sp.]